MPKTKITTGNLAAGIIAIGSGNRRFVDDLSPQILAELEAIKLIKRSGDKWQLTVAGQKLLPACHEGGELRALSEPARLFKKAKE